MCQFCAEHGEGKKWYYLMKNYSEELLHAEMTPAQQAVSGFKTRQDGSRYFMRGFVFPATGIKPLEQPLPHRETPASQKKKVSRKQLRKEIPDPQKFIHYGQVLPIEDVEKTIDLADSVTRMPCGCRFHTTGKENCRYCFGFAVDRYNWLDSILDDSTSLELMDKETAKVIIRKFDREGLMHSVWTLGTPYVIGVCNCDHDCGAYKNYIEKRGYPSFFRAEYICQSDWDRCKGCKNCMHQCQFGAMFYSSALEKVYIDPERCYGCGVCRSACSKDAIQLLPRESVPLAANLW